MQTSAVQGLFVHLEAPKGCVNQLLQEIHLLIASEVGSAQVAFGRNHGEISGDALARSS
jgi:hypothetical protein